MEDGETGDHTSLFPILILLKYVPLLTHSDTRVFLKEHLIPSERKFTFEKSTLVPGITSKYTFNIKDRLFILFRKKFLEGLKSVSEFNKVLGFFHNNGVFPSDQGPPLCIIVRSWLSKDTDDTSFAGCVTLSVHTSSSSQLTSVPSTHSSTLLWEFRQRDSSRPNSKDSPSTSHSPTF